MTDTWNVRFGLVTGPEPSGFSKDGEHLAHQLRKRGHTAEPIVWTEDEPSWRELDVLIVRSCWDYHEQPNRFREWLESANEAGVTLLNPLDAIRWNMHKRYLRDLAESGVEVLPTEWISQSSDVTLRSVLERNDWERAVVKPAIGTSSTGVWRTTLTEATADQPQFERALASQDILVQQFAHEITAGELSFVFLGGSYSHAIRSIPSSDEFRSHPSFGGSTRSYSPHDSLVDEAKDVLIKASEILEIPVEQLPYARIDVLERDGTLELMELELIEPYLGLDRKPGSPAMFANAIISSLGLDGDSADPTRHRRSISNRQLASEDQ